MGNNKVFKALTIYWRPILLALDGCEGALWPFLDPVLTKKDTFFSHEPPMAPCTTFLQIPMNAFFYLFNLLMVVVVPSELGIHVVCFVFIVNAKVNDLVDSSPYESPDSVGTCMLWVKSIDRQHFAWSRFSMPPLLPTCVRSERPAKNTKSFLKHSLVLAHMLKTSTYSCQTILYWTKMP